MEQKVVRKLEKEIEESVAEVCPDWALRSCRCHLLARPCT